MVTGLVLGSRTRVQGLWLRASESDDDELDFAGWMDGSKSWSLVSGLWSLPKPPTLMLLLLLVLLLRFCGSFCA